MFCRGIRVGGRWEARGELRDGAAGSGRELMGARLLRRSQRRLVGSPTGRHGAARCLLSGGNGVRVTGGLDPDAASATPRYYGHVVAGARGAGRGGGLPSPAEFVRRRCAASSPSTTRTRRTCRASTTRRTAARPALTSACRAASSGRSAASICSFSSSSRSCRSSWVRGSPGRPMLARRADARSSSAARSGWVAQRSAGGSSCLCGGAWSWHTPRSS